MKSPLSDLYIDGNSRVPSPTAPLDAELLEVGTEAYVFAPLDFQMQKARVVSVHKRKGECNNKQRPPIPVSRAPLPLPLNRTLVASGLTKTNFRRVFCKC